MSCPHATTTTVLWAWGEGPEEHLHHVVGCPDCQAVLEDASEVAPWIGELPAAPRRRWPLVLAGVIALAASVLAFLAVEAPVAPVEPVAAAPIPVLFEGDLDAELDRLDLALDALEHDLSTL